MSAVPSRTRRRARRLGYLLGFALALGVVGLWLITVYHHPALLHRDWVAFDNADLTSQDNTVGTPAYMAPEQVRGSRIDARADLFSLGCVLYYMAAGYSPFHGKSQAETIHKILDLNPPPLSTLIPGTPPVLSELIDKLLTKDPEQRYQSSLEVADILRRLQVQLNQSPTDELLDVLITKPQVAIATSHAKPKPTSQPTTTRSSWRR